MELTYALLSGQPLHLLANRAAGHGGIVWDAAVVLADAAQRTPAQSSGLPLRVLEIGAGCGLPGLALAASCRVDLMLSDRPPLVPLLQLNADRAALALSSRGSSVQCVALEFGARLRRLPESARPPYDLVLASDVLGCADEGAFEALLKTFSDVFAAAAAAGRACTVVMAYRPRAPWERAFFDGARARGWNLILRSKLSAGDVAAMKRQSLCAAGSAEAAAAATASSAEVPGSESAPLSDADGPWGSDVELWELSAPPPP